jgi:hypothetical protein
MKHFHSHVLWLTFSRLSFRTCHSKLNLTSQLKRIELKTKNSLVSQNWNSWATVSSSMEIILYVLNNVKPFSKDLIRYNLKLDAVTQVYNPSYLGGRDWDDHNWRIARAWRYWEPISTNKSWCGSPGLLGHKSETLFKKKLMVKKTGKHRAWVQSSVLQQKEWRL